MTLDPATRAFINKHLATAFKKLTAAIAVAVANLRADLLQVFLNQLPRHASFDLSNVAVGTQEQAVSWTVPIAGDYQIVASPTTGATPAGFLTASVKAGTKTATGCTLIVANRSAATIVAATFDVLAFPI